MPKNIDDVILPERRKSIRNIPIPPRDRALAPSDGRRKTDKVVNTDGVKRPAPRTIETAEPVRSQGTSNVETYRQRRSSRRKLFLALGVALLILIFAVLSLFNAATLAYVPKSLALSFNNETYSAQKTGEGKLLYSIVKLSGDKGVNVPVSGEEQVERKASGTIVVYNNASAESQRLVENTRFEAPTGKIYRIAKAITIPGKKMVNGVSQPGSIEAIVYADVAGAEYNTGLVDWTVPGLKGTPRYNTIYARSKTAMTGGFVGMEKTVKPDELAKAKTDLKAALGEELLAKAQAEVPADFILFPSLSSVTFEDLPQTSNGSTATVNLRGNLYGIMFKRSDLARELGESKTTLSADDNVELDSFDGLQISFAGVPPQDLLPLNEISFKVSGFSALLWRTDELALKSDLVGKKKSEVPAILKNYPTVSSADATLRPFWKTAFPDDAEKISIKRLKTE